MGCQQSSDVRERSLPLEPISNDNPLIKVSAQSQNSALSPIANTGNIGEQSKDRQKELQFDNKENNKNQSKQANKIIEKTKTISQQKQSQPKQTKQENSTNQMAIKPIQNKNLMSRTQYTYFLCDLLANNEKLNCVIDPKVFIDIKKWVASNYWCDNSKSTLNRLLEDCIQFILSLTCENMTNKSIFKNAQQFAKQFGKIYCKLSTQTNMKGYWIIESMKQVTSFFQSRRPILTNHQEMLKTAMQAKLLCDQQLILIFCLSTHLVKSCRYLQHERNGNIDQVLKQLHTIAYKINQNFSVKGVKERQKKIIQRQQISEEDANKFKSKKQSFSPIIIVFKTQQKQAQLQEAILKMVDVSKRNFDQFNNLFYASCVYNQGYGFKSNLKLQGPENKSSLYRVKQKLLKKQVQKLAKLNEITNKQKFSKCMTIHDRIKAEKKQMDKMMKQILSQMKEIPFTVSDLLRGKCLFNKVTDINKALQQIIKKIQQLPKQKNIKLVEIDNRLGDKNLTKDIVVKVKIQDIVCQFQMSLSFRLAQAEINHKMYELGRSLVLSDLSLLFQWNQKAQKEYFQIVNHYLAFYSNMSYGRTHVFEPSVMDLRNNLLYLCGLNYNFAEYKPETKYISPNKIQQIVNSCNKIPKNITQLSKNLMYNGFYFYKQNRMTAQLLPQFLKYQQQTQYKFMKDKQYQIIGGQYFFYEDYANSAKNYGIYAKSLIEKKQSNQKIDIALQNFGRANYQIPDYQKALKNFTQCLQIKDSLNLANSKEYCLNLTQICLCYLGLNQNEEAIKVYNTLIELQATIKINKNILFYADIYCNIGQICVGLKKYSDAFDNFNKCLVILANEKGKNCIQSIRALKIIAETYVKLDLLDEASAVYNKIIAIWRKSVGNGKIVNKVLVRKSQIQKLLKEKVSKVKEDSDSGQEFHPSVEAHPYRIYYY